MLTCLCFPVSDFHVPSEYLTNIHIRDKVIMSSITAQQWGFNPQKCNTDFFFFVLLSCFQLAAIKLARYGEDLLFYLYYMNGGDLLQLLAAVELWVPVQQRDCFYGFFFRSQVSPWSSSPFFFVLNFLSYHSPALTGTGGTTKRSGFG